MNKKSSTMLGFCGASRNLQKNGLSHKQKMLALHYMGLDLSKYDNTTYGNILDLVLAFMSIGSMLSYLNLLI